MMARGDVEVEVLGDQSRDLGFTVPHCRRLVPYLGMHQPH
jgi:hypothetical protein